MTNIKSIYYHNPKAEHVEYMIKWLTKKGYRFISDRELYGILTSKKKISEKLVYLSFDDAWRSNLEIIPIIEKYRVPITIFTPIHPLYSGNYWWEYKTYNKEELASLHSNGFPQKLVQLESSKDLQRSCMTIDEIIQLSQNPLVSLQAHTVHHPILTHVSDEELSFELEEANKKLSELTGRDILFFSYPNGSYSTRELNSVSKLFKMAFTIEMRHISINDSLYELPRVCLTGDKVKDMLKFYGVWTYIKRIRRLFK